MNELIDRFNAVPLTQKTLVLFLAMAAISAGYFMGLHSPMINEIDELNGELQSLDQQTEQLRVKSEGIDEMEQELGRVEAELSDMHQALTEDVVDVLEQLNSHAKSAQLRIERLQRQTPEDDDDLVATPVRMELEGTYNQIAEFFFAVGDMNRIITFSDVNMQRQGGYLEEEGVLEVTTTATTYHAHN